MTLLAHEKQIVEMEQTIEKLKEQNGTNPLFSHDEILKMERKLETDGIFPAQAVGSGFHLPPSAKTPLNRLYREHH